MHTFFTHTCVCAHTHTHTHSHLYKGVELLDHRIYIGLALVESAQTICCCEVTSVVSDSVQPHRRQPTRLPHPWDSPGKNTGVGCHFLLQSMKVKWKSLSRVRLFATPWTEANRDPPSMGFSRQEYWGGVPWPYCEGIFDGRGAGGALFAPIDRCSAFLFLLCVLNHPSFQFPYTLAPDWI